MEERIQSLEKQVSELTERLSRVEKMVPMFNIPKTKRKRKSERELTIQRLLRKSFSK